MDRFIVKTPRAKQTFPIPSNVFQDLSNPNTFDDPEAAHEANEAVMNNIFSQSINCIRKCYNKLSTDVQQKIGKYAVENGAENAVRKFRSTVDGLNVHTVRNWKVQHIQSINSMTSNRTAGRPVALGYDIDEKVKQHIRQMRLTDRPISNRIVICPRRNNQSMNNVHRYAIR